MKFNSSPEPPSPWEPHDFDHRNSQPEPEPLRAVRVVPELRRAASGAVARGAGDDAAQGRARCAQAVADDFPHRLRLADESDARMGREARQGAIGLVIDRGYLEIGFPLEQTVNVGSEEKT